LLDAKDMDNDERGVGCNDGRSRDFNQRNEISLFTKVLK